MPLKRIISLFCLLPFFALNALAHTANLEVGGTNPYKAIRLTPEIYNAANPDLSDILIHNGKGESVPYFMHTSVQKTGGSQAFYPMELIYSFLKDDSFYFDYKLSDIGEGDTMATSIEFSTPNADFAKTIDVYGSYDNRNWAFVQSDKLYVVDHHTKLSVTFHAPQKYTYYRFRLSNHQERIAFDSVTLSYSVFEREKTYFIETFSPVFQVENEEKTTNIVLEGLKNVRLHEIEIHTDSMFKRTVSAPSGIGKELYHLSLNDATYTDTVIPLQGSASQTDTYILTIMDNDDKPIKIDGISVRYFADEIIFEGNDAGPYTLVFGEDPEKTAPVYDIARYKDEVLKGTIDKAVITELRYDASAEEAPERDYQLIFHIIVVVIALLLGIIIVLRLKKQT